MSNLKGMVLVGSGLLLVVIGFITFFTVSSSGAGSAAASVGINLGATLMLPSIICWATGGGLTLWGALLLMQGGARRGDLQQIAAAGIETGAVITYVDRNYSLLLNNRPIYSIVEYRYRDGMGREFVNRADNVKTDLVIRNNWQVGSPIKVRYLPANPTKSGIMFAEV